MGWMSRCFRYNWRGSLGSRSTYRIGKSQEDTYTLHNSPRPEYFRIDPTTAKSLIDAAKRKSLVDSQSSA
jgi:hypothetical protein